MMFYVNCWLKIWIVLCECVFVMFGCNIGKLVVKLKEEWIFLVMRFVGKYYNEKFEFYLLLWKIVWECY